MKIITELNKKLYFVDEDLLDEKNKGTIPTYKQMLLRLACNPTPKDADEGVWSFQVAIKIRSATGDSVQLEDADFRLLWNRAKENVLGWNSAYIGQIKLKLEESQQAEKKE